MKYLRKSILLILLSASAFVMSLLAINYSVGMYRYHQNPLPYHLSFHAIGFEYRMESDEGLRELCSLEDTNLVMILEKNQGKELGVYDPGMVYYSDSFVFEVLGEYRYFSREDYETGRRVGVYVNSNPQDISFLIDQINYRKKDGVITGLASSPLADKGAYVVWNFFALKPQKGDLIYVDSNSPEVIEKVRKLLVGLDCVELELEKGEETDLGEAIGYGLMAKYSAYMLFGAAFVLVFAAVSFFIFMAGQKRRIFLNELYGGGRLAVLRIYGVPVLFAMGLSCLLAGGLIRKALSAYWHLSMKHLGLLWAIYFLYTCFLYLIFFGGIHLQRRRVEK